MMKRSTGPARPELLILRIGNQIPLAKPKKVGNFKAAATTVLPVRTLRIPYGPQKDLDDFLRGVLAYKNEKLEPALAREAT